jgi:ferrous-iron efflux pump FieF
MLAALCQNSGRELVAEATFCGVRCITSIGLSVTLGLGVRHSPGCRGMQNKSNVDTRPRRLASRVSLVVAVILVVVKLVAWIATGSVALLSSAVDALVDTAASLATFLGVRYAERPPDQDHRFGHGKGEAVAGFTQAALLAGAALTIAAQAVERLFSPQPIQLIGLGLVVIVASIIAASGLVVMQTVVVQRTGSTAIAADRAHYATDIAVNLAVLAALGVTRLTGWERTDPIFALAISSYMFWSSRGIALEALKQLLDHELSSEKRKRISDAVLACPNVRGLHDLRTRYAGDRIFVEFHLEVDGGLTIDRGHAVGDAAEASVERLFPSVVEVTAHLEPAGIKDERLDDRV